MWRFGEAVTENVDEGKAIGCKDFENNKLSKYLTNTEFGTLIPRDGRRAGRTIVHLTGVRGSSRSPRGFRQCSWDSRLRQTAFRSTADSNEAIVVRH